MRYAPGMTPERLRPCRGFTMIEVIVTMVLLGVLSAVLYATQGFMDTELAARAGLLRNQIRYAQLRAMKGGAVYGLRCQGTDYWLFVTEPTAAANRVALPGEETTPVHLAATGVTLSEFTLYFDAAGQPYTNDLGTPVSAASALNIVMAKGSSSVTLSVTPETGFVP